MNILVRIVKLKRSYLKTSSKKSSVNQNEIFLNENIVEKEPCSDKENFDYENNVRQSNKFD